MSKHLQTAMNIAHDSFITIKRRSPLEYQENKINNRKKLKLYSNEKNNNYW